MRRRVNLLCRSGGAAAAIRRTRSRSSNGTSGWAARISATTSRCDMECLLELLESAVQASGAIGGGDPEHPRRGRGVEIEHDAEGDNLALAGGQSEQCRFEVGREAFDEALVDPLGGRGELLPAGAPPLGEEVVERRGAGDLAEPGAGRSALRIEPRPEPQSAFERLAGQILGRRPVAREPHEVAVDVFEMPLGGLREARHTRPTPPPPRSSHRRPPPTCPERARRGSERLPRCQAPGLDEVRSAYPWCQAPGFEPPQTCAKCVISAAASGCWAYRSGACWGSAPQLTWLEAAGPVRKGRGG